MLETPPASTGRLWKEHVLDDIPVAAEDIGDAVMCLLHTILFTRAPGPVRPSEASCQAFPNITYALCAVGDVSRKVDQAVRRFEESVMLGSGSSYLMGGSSSLMTPFGHQFSMPMTSIGGAPSNVRGATSGYIVVAFFERKVKKALFGLMSNEEKTVFEKWIVPVTVTSSPAASHEERELCAGETEAALQNALLHILTAVQSIEHIPLAMYDFEIWTCKSFEAAQLTDPDKLYGLVHVFMTRLPGSICLVALQRLPLSDVDLNSMRGKAAASTMKTIIFL